jgi:hypothetical protein
MTGSASHQVLWARNALDSLKVMRDNLKDSVRRQALAEVIRILDPRLRTEPLLVGEVYRPSGGFAEHLSAHELVAIDFAVDSVRKIVLVRHAYPLPHLGV